jgi:hypothetical protein
MVREFKMKDRTVYQCEFCDMGYVDLNDAEGCEEYCGTHDSCSTGIAKKAIHKPSLDFMS